MEKAAVKTSSITKQSVPYLERQSMWLNLPSPIVEECLTFLCTRDVMSASCTCKDWQNITTSSKVLIQNTVFDRRFSMYARKEIEADTFVIHEKGFRAMDIIDIPLQNAVAIHYHNWNSVEDDYVYICVKESGQHIDTIKFGKQIACIGLSEDKTKLFIVQIRSISDEDVMENITIISLGTNQTFNKSNECEQIVISPKYFIYPNCVTGTNEKVFVGNNRGQIVVLSLSCPVPQEGHKIDALPFQDGCQKGGEIVRGPSRYCNNTVKDLIVWKNKLYFAVDDGRNSFFCDSFIKMYDLNDGSVTNFEHTTHNVKAMVIVNSQSENPLLYTLHGKKIKVWSMSGECFKEIDIDEEFCCGLAISDADYRFFTFHKKVIKLWTMDGKLLECFPPGQNSFRRFMCSQSGYLYTDPDGDRFIIYR